MKLLAVLVLVPIFLYPILHLFSSIWFIAALSATIVFADIVERYFHKKGNKTAAGITNGVCYIVALLLAALLRPESIIAITGATVAALGIATNYTVLAVNGMKMPVKELIEASETHIPMNETTKLPWLGDRIPVFGGIASPGDIMIASGLWILAIGLWFG